MKKHLSTILLVGMFLVGLCIMLYPTVSDWWNQRVQSRAIVNYEQNVQDAEQDQIEAMFKKAEKYNRQLRKLDAPLVEHEKIQGYYSMINPLENSMMGYVLIPKLSVELPVYQGVSSTVLQTSVGHLPGTSLPIGGKGTHAVISAHRGLPSAKLFTDLDKMEVGDEFIIKVMDRTLSYEVDQIVIVEPDDLRELDIVDGKDYATLMTCTPYGINTHRLLVRGKRVKAASEEIFIKSDAYIVDSLILVPIIATPILFILLFILFVHLRRKRKE